MASASEIWRAAEFAPASSGADNFSSSTLVDPITSPMPRQPTPQASASVHTGTHGTSTAGAPAMAAATNTIPITISRSRYGATRPLDWIHEPPAQVSPPNASENPASVGLSPRWVTSISGTKLSAAMNEPAATPRSSTTAGSPRRARYVPRGSSPSTAGTSSPAPTAPGTSDSHRRSWAAYWSSPAPTEIPSASRIRRRSNATGGASGSTGPDALRRIAGSATASGTTTSTGIPRNTQRHPRCSVTVPEASGPTIDGTTQLAAKAAMIAGRSRSS